MTTPTTNGDPSVARTKDQTGAIPQDGHVPDPRLRHLVRDTLQRAPSYQALEAVDRTKLAKNLARVVDYLEDPHAGMGPEVASAAQSLEGALADDPSDALRRRVAGGEGQVGQDFKAGAVTQGADTFTKGMQSTTVDFVKFVSGLIEGVFTSIVNSTIKQMMAFATFLEQVAKSVGDFTSDNVSQNQARDSLVNKYPNALQLDGLDSGEPKVVMKDDIDDKLKPNFKADLGIDANLEDDGGEEAIVQGMRLQMGRQRQKLLSQILLMGINRIVVTEGEIKASVLFQVDATDTSNRTNTAAMHDAKTDYHRDDSSSFWGTDSSTNVNTRISTVDASDTDSSSAKAQLHTKLTGSVTVKFKSDVFPLERFATDDQKSSVQGKTGGG